MERKFFSSSNPVMKEETYIKQAHQAALGAPTMTVQGAINKTLILSGILLLSSAVSWVIVNPVLIYLGIFGGLISVLVATFRPQSSSITAPLYAMFEGLALGAISAIYASAYHGIVFQAFTLTLAILFMMLMIYKYQIIEVTNQFRVGVVMATGAVFLVYMLSFILSFFGINLPYLHQGGMIGIGISVVIIVIASLNLLLDFDNFDKGEAFGAPAYMEWYSAMGLLITLVWLYLEILRLLARLNSRN